MKNKHRDCVFCKTNQFIEERTSVEKIKSKKETVEIPILYCICTQCNTEFITSDQIKINDDNFVNALTENKT